MLAPDDPSIVLLHLVIYTNRYTGAFLYLIDIMYRHNFHRGPVSVSALNCVGIPCPWLFSLLIRDKLQPEER